jgi:hypothetical protein
MHPRLKLLLLRGRLSYKGFALPIALGVGLILLLVSVMAIVRSQGQATNTFSQRQNARGLAVTETAVSRYQNLMQKNPAMMTYCANPSSQSPCNSGTTWSNLTGSILGGSATCNSIDTATTKVINGQSVQVYEYLVNSINMSGNSTLTITPGQRVTFYLDGDIDSQGNSNVVHSCQDAANNPIPNCKPTDFQIFGYGGSGSKICLIGNKVIEAFILAPNYTGGVSGAGGGAGGIKGSVWLGSWSTGGSCGSNTTNSVIQQQARWDELGLTPKNLPPKLGGGGSWGQQIVP